jgi:thioredoxin reductase (NADPH)
MLRTAQGVVGLHCTRRPYTVQVSNGTLLKTRCILIATGASYRKLPHPDCDRYQDRDIYYAATATEARHCDSVEVAIVGGGNSAGQAAVFLANTARHVHILVRGDGLADSMSNYLIGRIAETPNITLHRRTEIVALEGSERLSRVVWKTGPGGKLETREIGHLFLMTGAVPNTQWLGGCVDLDAEGFVLTGAVTSAGKDDRATSRPPSLGFHEPVYRAYSQSGMRAVVASRELPRLSEKGPHVFNKSTGSWRSRRRYRLLLPGPERGSPR